MDEPQTARKYTCVGCRCKFDSAESQRAHFKTEWHLYNLKRRVCKLEPLDLESFSLIQSIPANLDNNRKQSQPKPDPIESDLVREDGDEDDEDNWVDEDEEEDEIYADDEDEIEEVLARVVKSDTCLFCDKRSANLESNLIHMNLTHGFFIPEEKYVVDLAGLMRYLGFKVGAGTTCLWCNKQFSTLRGVRLHMLYKDHCKIMYDQSKAIEEFQDFYDYSTQEKIAMKPLDQLAIPRKNHIKLADKKALVSTSRKTAIVANREAIQVQAKAIKKFSIQRARFALRVGMTNNNAIRGRLRQQNPI